MIKMLEDAQVILRTLEFICQLHNLLKNKRTAFLSKLFGVEGGPTPHHKYFIVFPLQD